MTEPVECPACGGLHCASVIELMITDDACTCACCEPHWVERGRRALRAENARRVAAHAAELALPPLPDGLKRGFPWHLFRRSLDVPQDVA